MSNDSESDLPIFESLEDLSTRLYDYSNAYFLPLTCVFGLITSSFCVLGSFRKDTTSSKSLNFILIYSLVDFLFLLSQFFVFTFRCGALCSFSYDYFPQFYQIQIFWLVGYTFVNSQCLFGIYISITRFRLFTTRKGSTNPNLFIIYALCAVVALCANLFVNSLPYHVVPMGIYQPNNMTTGRILYTTDFVAWSQTEVMQQLITVVIVVKDPVLYVIYCAINVLIIVRFRRFITKKQALVMPTIYSRKIFIFCLYN